VGEIRGDQRRVLQEQGIGLTGSRIRAAALAGVVALLVAGCGDSSDEQTATEPFAPRVAIEAVGGSARTDKPQLDVKVAARRGDANIRSAEITLPAAILADQTALGNLCSESELEDKRCAGRQRMGEARALSPAYDVPLTGPVYAVSGSGGLPKPAYVLSGGGAEVILRGRIEVVGQRIQATVDDVPDIPLDAFELSLDGGKSGYLVLSRDICRTPAVANVRLTSQEGESLTRRVPIEARCGS